MARVPHALLLVLVFAAWAALAPGAHSAVRRGPIELAQAVERRASATDFAQLEAFGRQAVRTPGRESLNRLYHVTWITLNQGDFDKAGRWNATLEAAARRQGDLRYIQIARLNALSIRYDHGETAVVGEIRRIAESEQDWFVKAHATRLTALAMMDEGRTGEALKLLNAMDAAIPEDDPFAVTAHAGLWEVVGIGLMDLNDIHGATDAFGRFEIDYSDPAYPRPDFDAVYNLARLAAQIGDNAMADRLYAIHHRLAERANIESLSVYDANLCATVAEARGSPRGVLKCLAPYGQSLGAAEFLAPMLLPMRATAYAETGQIDAARRDLAEIQRRVAAGNFREEGISGINRAKAALLFAQGRSAEAYVLLKAQAREEAVQSARRFSDGIGQVTGDMQAQLTERRHQLETARANTSLQEDVITSQRWIVGIAVAFVVSAFAMLFWQWRLGGHLRIARQRAEEASRSKSEFLANMSHEIRTPLNGVVAMADALGRRPLGEADREMVDIIRSSGVTLERLLSDILDSAKIEAGQVTLETTAFEINAAVRDIVALWQPTADEKGVRLEAEIDPSLPRTVTGDVVRVRQVLANLVSNALKFTGSGSVRLTVAPSPDGLVRFTVADTGLGFDAEQKARIFGRFHQADGSITRRFGGTGLGLAISRDLAVLMGGRLDCEGIPGQGATFWLEVPLPPADAIDEADRPAGEVNPGDLRILLADDHPANRKVIEVLLSPTGARIVAVENGREAVAAFAAGEFDLVLMDMQMPVMDGLAATREIRRLESGTGRRRTPVLMLTANAMPEHVAAGRAAGSDGHLAKPVTTDTLFAGINVALDAVGDQTGDEVRAA